ncbi:MAG: sensor histidine kinase [Flavobacteriales bacterium]
MGKPINILVLEDSEDDYELSMNYLRMSEIEPCSKVVWTKDEFEHELESQQWDIILCDYDMPQFNAMDAIQLLQEKKRDIPLIVISGSISEEIAVETIKAGAKDYLMKDKLMKLPFAVARELRAAKEEKEKMHRELAMAQYQRKQNALLSAINLSTILITISENKIIESVNQRFCELTGYTPEEVIGKNIMALVDDDTIYKDVIKNLNKAIEEAGFLRKIVKIKSSTKMPIWTDVSIIPIKDEDTFEGYLLHANDVTQKLVEANEKNKLLDELVKNNQDLEQFNYIVSHNLRSPVAKIIGLANILGYSGIDHETKERVIKNIQEESVFLDGVLKDLTTITSIRKGIDQSFEEISIVEQITAALHLFESEKDDTQINLSIEISESLKVKAIKSYMQSIFYNLLSNSSKFRNIDVPLKIVIEQIEETDSNVTIKFEDNGQGIDLNKYGSKIFGLYNRFHQHIQGKGMGLYLIKTQIERLGGSIAVTSNPGEGTSFMLTFQKWK